LWDADADEKYTETTWESTDNLTPVGDGTYYAVDRDRDDIYAYMSEYSDIVNELKSDKRKSFAWIATMSDMVNNDFEAVYENVKDNGTLRGEGGDVDRLFEYEPLTKVIRTDPGGGELHARWIQRAYIEREWEAFGQMLTNTYEDYVYPVWFETGRPDDGSDTPVIRDPSRDGNRDFGDLPILLGSEEVLGRLNREQLGSPLLRRLAPSSEPPAQQAVERVMFQAERDLNEDADAN
jgi:hypothetical protein